MVDWQTTHDVYKHYETCLKKNIKGIFMKSFSKEEIQSLIQSPEELKQAIIDSKGFVLYLADKYTISFTPELLINTINQYSIRFIVEHMKSHKYSPDQNEIIINYLKEDEDEYQTPIPTEYTLTQLLKDIKEDNELPPKLDKVLTLTFEDFLSHQKEFSTLISRNGNDYWSHDPFYNSHDLLSSIFRSLTKEDFLKIDKKTLYSCPSLFNMSRHLMNDDDIRVLFNESVQEYHKKPDVVKSGYKPKLEYYKNYTFRENEKELFLSLLKNNYSNDYETISKYKGFNYFFTRDEYILNHNIGGIRHFSQKEIADYLPEIRKGILAAYFNSHHHNIESIYQLRISEDSFKDIFKPSFVQEIIERCHGFYFNHFDRDNQKKTDFMNQFHKHVLTLCANNTEILNLVGVQNCINNITSVIEHDRKYFNEVYANAAQSILGNFEVSLKTDYLFTNFDKNAACFAEYDVPGLIFNAMKGKESINYLYALIQIHNAGKNYKQNVFKEEINRIIPLLPSEDVKLVSKALDYKISSKLLKNNPKQNFENNFLNFTPEIIASMSFDTFTSIFSLSKDFRATVLNSNLDNMIIDNYLENKNERYGNNFIRNLLSSLDSNKSPYFSFVKNFIKRNKEFMLEHYFSNLVTHPLREELIKIDTVALEEDSYKKITSIMGEFCEKELSYSQQYALKEGLSKKEQKKIDQSLKNLEEEKKNLSEKIAELLPNFSFSFYSKKVKESNIINAIELYNISKENKKEYQHMVFDKVESLDFNNTKQLLSNKEFLSFMFNHKYDNSSSSREKERPVYFNPQFTDTQNIEIVETLLTNFNDSTLFKKQYESNVSLSKVISLISPDKRYEIANDLVVKHDPVELFNSYDYLPQKNGYFLRHVKTIYSNEQILKAIENLNSQGLKIISSTGQNTTHDNLLSYNFKHEEKKGEKSENPHLSSYLSLLKSLEHDPINYLACIHSDIVQNFTNDKQFQTRDLALSDFFDKHINIDVVINAMKDIFDIHKEMYEDRNIHSHDFYKGIAVPNAERAISNFLAFTYSSTGDVYSSEFSEDKSKKILQMLIKEAPYYLFSCSHIGKINSQQEFSLNFEDYNHNNLIEDFFISSSKNAIVKDHFSLDYSKKDQWQSSNADDFIKTIVKNFTEKQDFDSIHKLDFIIKETQFNEDRPYSKRLREFSSVLSSFIANKEYEQLIEKSLGYIKIFKLSEKLADIPRVKVKSNKI